MFDTLEQKLSQLVPEFQAQYDFARLPADDAQNFVYRLTLFPIKEFTSKTSAQDVIDQANTFLQTVIDDKVKPTEEAQQSEAGTSTDANATNVATAETQNIASDTSVADTAQQTGQEDNQQGASADQETAPSIETAADRGEV